MKKIFFSFIYILFIFVFIQGCSNKQVSEQIELAQKQLECGATVDSDKTIENILPKVKNKKDLAKILSLKAEISAGKGFFENRPVVVPAALSLNEFCKRFLLPQIVPDNLTLRFHPQTGGFLQLG